MIIEREEIEWTNSWIEDANQPDKRRLLLVGDSVTRQIRKTVSAVVVERGISVDLLACSYSFFDSRFFEEIKHFFSGDYQYEVIVLMDIHHRMISERCMDNKKLAKEYLDKWIMFYEYLKTKGERVFVCTMTPYRGDYYEENREVNYRNSIIRNSCLWNNGIDLGSMIDIKEHVFSDHVHFCGAYNLVLSYRIVAEIFGEKFRCSFPKIIEDIEQLNMMMKRNVVVLGKGKKAKIIRRFINENTMNHNISFANELDDLQIDKSIGDNTIVVMTIDAMDLEKKLLDRKYKYCYFGESLLSQIEDKLLFEEVPK